jgi:hypothetical protein
VRSSPRDAASGRDAAVSSIRRNWHTMLGVH